MQAGKRAFAQKTRREKAPGVRSTKNGQLGRGSGQLPSAGPKSQAYSQENGHLSKKWRRKGKRREKATGARSKKIWQLSQHSGQQHSARPEQTGRPPKTGAGRARRAVEKAQRESTKKETQIAAWEI